MNQAGSGSAYRIKRADSKQKMRRMGSPLGANGIWTGLDNVKTTGTEYKGRRHRLNMELDLHYLGSMCTVVLIG
jgi:hypothetical protein